MLTTAPTYFTKYYRRK